VLIVDAGPLYAIHENDVVELTQPVLKVQGTGHWPADTRGTVVAEHGEYKLIEISDDANYGQMLDMVSVTENRLKLITKYS
jgi:hypothetical protein